MKLKLVAITNVYKNIGNMDLQMWRCTGANEYIVARFEEEPTWKVVGEHINKFIHSLEGKISDDIKEAYSGFEIYAEASLTHGENFQLNNGGTIDFPAQDVTKIDVSEEMDGILGT